jgi:hypothetical protein
MKKLGLLCILLALCSSAFAQSSLDQGGETCGGATVIPASASVFFAESGVLGNTDDCGISTAIFNDVWYSFTPTAAGSYLISACNSDGSLSFEIWQGAGNCCSGTLPVAAWKDAANGCGSASLDPRKLITNIVAGTTYYIELGLKAAGSPSAYNFQLQGPIPATPSVPSNDACAGATAISVGSSAVYSDLGATDDAGIPTCGTSGNLLSGVWYSVIGDGHTLTASTVGVETNINSFLRVYRGSCASLVCMGNNDNINTDSSASVVSWCSDVGVTYYIVVSTFASTLSPQGSFRLSISEGDICSCDAVALCGTPVETDLSGTGNNTCAAFDATQLTSNQTIYARHCPEADSDFFKITCQAGKYTTIKVYDGASCTTFPATKVTNRLYKSDCTAGAANSTAAKIISRCGIGTDTTVYLLVLDFGAGTPINRAAYKVEVTTLDAVTNDDCSGAIEVGANSAISGQTLCGATVDNIAACNFMGYSLNPATSGPGVWYKLIGNGHLISADACISSFNNKINVYHGPDCGSFVCHGGDNDTCVTPNTQGAKYTFCTAPGEIYWILVYGSASTDVGTFTLTTTDLGPCDQNDRCSGAIAVAVPSVNNGTTVGSTPDDDFGAPTCSQTPSWPGVWYKVTGTGHTFTADLCTNFGFYNGARLLVYSGACNSLTCVTGVEGFDCSGAIPARRTWCSQAAVDYFIYVAAWAGNQFTQGFTGPFTLTMTDGGCCVPVEDYMANPIVLPHVLSYNNTFTNSTCCVSNPIATIAGHASGPDVIYEFTTSAGSAINSISVSGPSDNQIILFTNLADPAGSVVAQSDNGGAGVTEVLTNAFSTPGTYYIGTSVAGTGCGSLTLNVSSDVYLPVQMRSSEAIPGDGSVTLRWSTASEIENARFEIVRDGNRVGSVRSLGNSAEGHNYNWTEAGLTNGTRYEYVLRSVSLDGTVRDLVTLDVTPSMNAAAVTEYALYQNYPNPFNPTTTIIFDLVEAGSVNVSVFNLMGQQVASVVNGPMSVGRHMITFDGSNLPSAIYLCRLEVNGFTTEKKMLLMK